MRILVSIVVAAGIIASVLLSGSSLLSAEATAEATVVESSAPVPSEENVSVVISETSTSAVAATSGIAITSTDREAATGRWGLDRIAVSAAWDSVSSFRPVLVAVLDTGIDPNSSIANRVKAGIDFTGGGNTDDEHGHGTHMTSTIAAIAPNASFINLKVADARGRCDSLTVAKAIRWAADRGVQIINVSLEVEPSDELSSAVSHAWQMGAIVIAAAGNGGTTTPTYPAAYVNAIAVAGTNQNDGLTVMSNHGDWVDVAAPGSTINAEIPGGEFGNETGTSPAASHVSGVAALLYGVALDVSGNGFVNDEVRSAIEENAMPVAIDGLGSGIVNASTSVLAIAA
ncbi:MAG: S8 family serine peptidase [Dehalococcoidia bacterium]|nr:S8 family serine peptidase [Dehalococcoidia bacterium]